MSSPNPLSSSTSLSRVPSQLPKVPDFEDLPEVPPGTKDIELDHIFVEQEPNNGNDTTEIQLAYVEQKQNYEVEHAKDTENDYKGEDHLMSARELAAKYETLVNHVDPAASQGLSDQEVQNRLEKYGRNVITPASTIPEWKKFLKEFTGVFSIMLELAGLGCIVNYALQKAPENLFLGIVLWLVVIISGSLNYHQTRKSSRVMSGFGSLVPPRSVVIRDGRFQTIPASDLVPGDLLRVKGGDKIPADMRLIQCNGLKVDNSSLTGESEPLARTVDTSEPSPFEATNLVFMGTLCLEGEATGIVLNTGDRTVLGKTAQLAMRTTAELTVLQQEIRQFVKRISIIGVAVGIIVLIISVSTGVYWMDAIVFGVGSIVAIVPEGLQLTVTLALTLTAGRMARNNVLVKKLAIVETLGCTSVICSDKTGTLTQNNMTVSYIVYNNSIHQCINLIHTLSRIEQTDAHYRVLAKAAALCNRAFFDVGPDGNKIVIGDASESALLRYVTQIYDIDQMRADFPKVAEIPFNSENKWQLSIHKETANPNAPFRLLLKGAPERVLSRCTHIFLNDEIRPLDETIKGELEAIIEELAAIGQRVLGFSELLLDPTTYHPDYEFNTSEMNFPTTGLCFVGFVAIYDPPRDQVDEAISVCQGAGIKVVMVTGDHPATAKAIAKQIGIIKGQTPDELLNMEGCSFTKEEARREAPAIVVSGHELDSFTQEDWDIVTSKGEIVFARTSPEQKLQIVSQFQAKNEIVAVTGDGVNDSPALKRADVGIAMGITGSAVAKEAADIILMDDNFATIVHAVEEGRLIFDNLKKSIAYALSVKLAEVLPFLAFVIFGLPLPLSTVLVLCIDIGTDLIPGISLAYEKAELTLMTRRPRIPKLHKLVNVKLVFFSLIHMGIIQMLSGFTSYFLSMHNSGFSFNDLWFTDKKYFTHDAPDLEINGRIFTGEEQRVALAKAQTAFFCSIILTQLADVTVCKTRYLSFFQQKSRNFLQFLGMLIAVLVAILFAYIPGVGDVLGTHPIDGIDWAYMIPFSLFMFGQDELRKFWIRHHPHGKVARYTYW
jgi:sodium/potassium-transporting ATPase subunit alpha